ncbi:MAG: bifunctional adenosylcobinamide kinase/adenosylcobinamide-phosphate guanylyltransferase [Nocardioides sp.]|nr:bifunctional adenosylcobinamide kinase/adenosylcobinamide-phosphate guanylyltransferase [Nocardioides sp.]
MDSTAPSTGQADPPGKVLVTGGVRSGKSTHAESLFAGRTDVTYVAAGPTYDDSDWLARVDRHRARRPASWRTVESTDVASVLAATTGPALVDCLGTWLTATIDEAGLWEAPVTEVEARIGDRVTALVDALQASPAPVVLVTNEVGFGVVPEHRSGRLFRDLLGTANQRLAAVCDEVHLVVAGRVLRL